MNGWLNEFHLKANLMKFVSWAFRFSYLKQVLQRIEITLHFLSCLIHVFPPLGWSGFLDTDSLGLDVWRLVVLLEFSFQEGWKRSKVKIPLLPSLSYSNLPKKWLIQNRSQSFSLSNGILWEALVANLVAMNAESIGTLQEMSI